jgi:hypothetical protein
VELELCRDRRQALKPSRRRQPGATLPRIAGEVVPGWSPSGTGLGSCHTSYQQPLITSKSQEAAVASNARRGAPEHPGGAGPSARLRHSGILAVRVLLQAW